MQISSTKPTRQFVSNNSANARSAGQPAEQDEGDRFVESSRLPGMFGRGLAVAGLGAVPLMGVTAQAGFTNKPVPSRDYKPGSLGQMIGWVGIGANLLGTGLLVGAMTGADTLTGAAIALGTSSALGVYNDLTNSEYEFIRKG